MICLLRLLFIIYSTLLGFFPLPMLSYLGTLSSPFFLDLHISLVTYVVHHILRRLTLHNTRFCLCSRLHPFTWTRIHSATLLPYISSFMLTAFVVSVYQSTIALPSYPLLKTLLRILSIHRGKALIAIQSPSFSRLLNQKPKMYYVPLGLPSFMYPILILSTYRLSSTPLSSLVFSLSLSTTSTFCT